MNSGFQKRKKEGYFQVISVLGPEQTLMPKRKNTNGIVCVCRWSWRVIHGFGLLLFNHSVVSSSLQPHGLQHARLTCPLPTPGACPNSCPLSRWCHLAILSSVVPFSSCPQSFPASGSFLSESALHIRWPKYWSFSFSISPSNEYSGLISFRIDLFDLLAVQGTLKNLLQHHNSKASILSHSTFFMVQLSHPYMTTGKTIPLTKQTFVDKVMSLLFNMLSYLICCHIQVCHSFSSKEQASFNFLTVVTICSDFGA